nr:hypothetical protein CFP56_03345 [Quercus suber]
MASMRGLLARPEDKDVWFLFVYIGVEGCTTVSHLAPAACPPSRYRSCRCRICRRGPGGCLHPLESLEWEEEGRCCGSAASRETSLDIATGRVDAVNWVCGISAMRW